MRLVAYGTDVSSIIEAGVEKTEDAIYTHKFADSVEPLLRTDMIRSVLIVSKRRDPILEKIINKYGVPYRYKTVKTKWYEDFISKHLLEPRIREFEKDKIINEYPYVLIREYKTLKILYKVVNNYIPRKCGGFIYLYTKHRVPTVDFAVLLHLKYGGHVCVSSQRDTGLAFACVTSPETATELYKRFRQETPIIKFTMSTILTGFIVTFPESPHVLHQDITRMLSEVETKGKPTLPPLVTRKFPFLEAVLDNLSYKKFGKIKTRLYKDKIPFIENGRYDYVLLHKIISPLYTFKDGNKFTLYRIHLPIMWRIAVYTKTENPRIVVDNRLVKPERKEETVTGYLHYLPRWVVARINKYVERMKTGLIAVFPNL